MGRMWLLNGVALAALVAGGGIAHAQSYPSAPPPPLHRVVDRNGVDLISGALVTGDVHVSIGSSGSGKLARTFYNNGLWDNYTGAINSNGSTYTVSIGDRSESFTLSGSTYANAQGGGSTLSASGGTYTYTAADGTVGLFSTSWAGTIPTQANVARITSLTKPSGEKLTFTYETVNLPSSGPGQRLQSVNNNFGYQLKYTYGGNSGSSSAVTLSTVTAINNAVEYCSPSADSCSLSGTWPSATYSGTSVTDALGNTTSYAPTSMQWAGGLTATIGYDGSNRVISYFDGSGYWYYGYSTSSGTQTTSVNDPDSHTRTVTSNLASALLLTDADGLSHTTTYGHDGYGRVNQVTLPLGNYLSLSYDGRGNVTQTTSVAVSGSGLSNIVTYAGYDSSCTYAVKCNKPNSTTDALGNETDYAYDNTYGVMLTATAPAPTSGAVRPQTRLTYTSLSAYYQQGSGSVAAGPAIYRVTGTSQCATSSSCSGTSDEIVGAITYGSAGVANNLSATLITKRAGDSSVSATSNLAYDNYGNVYTKQDPNGNTTRYRYDANQNLVGVVGPNPGGSLANRAVRNTYSGGLLKVVEQGTVPSQSDSDWSSFSSLMQKSIGYDSRENKSSETFTAGGTTYAVSQVAFDIADQPVCSAVLMNSSTLSSPPTPCYSYTAPTVSSDGPDRIGYSTFDAAYRKIGETRGYDTFPSFQRSKAFTYTNNNKLLTSTDDNGNLTTYQYDGFDRLTYMYYPSKTTVGSSSTTDYEQYTYDADSRITADRRRDGTTISLAYDYDSRLTTAKNGATLRYDNIGRLTSAVLSSQTDSYAYDALGRVTGHGQPLGTVSYQYDAGGRRTRTTWPDSYYVNYTFDAANDLTAIEEYGATSGAGLLATFTYDNLGRRTGLSRGNGVSTSYGYDGISRLTSLSHSGSSNNISYTLGYNAASQINSKATSNSAYDWGGTYSARSYTSNGQNQITASGSLTLSYDSRGNLTSDSVNSYGYNEVNQMTTFGSSVTLSYDPLGRLYQTAGSSTTRFLYDGADLIAEYDTSGNVLRRFVHGPGTDETLVWDEGSGTSNRQWLLANDAGSIIAVTNSSATVTNINTYDDYGIPGSSNTGRFQYTGQSWIPEIGMYNYKAREYSPTLGRFMQTDPIGYISDANLYAYTHNDPVNMSDPTGLVEQPTPDSGPSPTNLPNYGQPPIQEVVVTGQRIPQYWITPINPFDQVQNLTPPSLQFLGGSTSAGHSALPQNMQNPNCKGPMNKVDAAGQTVTNLGDKVTVGGVVTAGTGYASAGVGVVTADLPLAFVGGSVGDAGVAIAGGGKFVALQGKIVSAVSGNTQPLQNEIITDVLDLVIPGKFFKDLAGLFAGPVVDRANGGC